MITLKWDISLSQPLPPRLGNHCRREGRASQKQWVDEHRKRIPCEHSKIATYMSSQQLWQHGQAPCKFKPDPISEWRQEGRLEVPLLWGFLGNWQLLGKGCKLCWRAFPLLRPSAEDHPSKNIWAAQIGLDSWWKKKKKERTQSWSGRKSGIEMVDVIGRANMNKTQYTKSSKNE